ncbi:GPI anchored protein [Aspergillus bombycis]|uniref:GPI anchored protein n=1 Tax=Aspergillus bombycis TaxID=109264 RepID=A0A1F7ZN09_9EURO|nr:GPI anchored protein [Aspergillus bombycis]OGM40518.1 GPI anchored protein [Aspergillus bombycis]
MAVKLLMGLAMAGLISASSSVTSMFLLGLDPQSLEASIVGNDATATTYSVSCAPPPTATASDEDDYGYDCGLGPGLTVTDASPTIIYELNEKPEFYMTVKCSVAGTTSAVCTETAGGPEANFPGTTISTIQQSEMAFVPVTITAGSVTSVAATASATTTAESGSQGTTSAAQTSSKSSASSSGSSSSSSSSAVSTGGMPQITGDAGMLFGGAVVALAAAVL